MFILSQDILFHVEHGGSAEFLWFFGNLCNSAPFLWKAAYVNRTGQPSVLEAHKCVTQVKVHFSSSWTTKPSRMPTSRMAASLIFVLAARGLSTSLQPQIQFLWQMMYHQILQWGGYVQIWGRIVHFLLKLKHQIFRDTRTNYDY